VPPGVSGVTAIAAGEYHSLALKSDGTVVGWGNDTYHQAETAGLSRVTAISAGYYDSLALVPGCNGHCRCLGRQLLGRGYRPGEPGPVTAVAAGEGFSVELWSDGTVGAWGTDVWGRTDVPAGLSGVASIAASWYHSLALKSDGTVVAWGADGSGTAVPAACRAWQPSPRVAITAWP